MSAFRFRFRASFPAWFWLTAPLAAVFVHPPALANPPSGHAAAAEAPQYSGIDLTLVEGLKAARVDGFTSGFTADFKGGLVRVYVMPSAQAASWWVARMATVVEKQKPQPVPFPAPLPASVAPIAESTPTEPPPAPLLLDSAEELLASGDRLVIARVGNVGLMVEVAAGAREKAEAVLAQLSDHPSPWPVVPPLERTASGWVVPPTPDLVVRYEGGTLGPGAALQFLRPPTALVVYDTAGRATRQAYDSLGLPISADAPWSAHIPTERPPPETP